MKVIFQRDIPHVAKTGDIKDVADGYARNYLLPRNFAVTATGGALKEHKIRQDFESNKSARLLAGAQAEAEKLNGLTLTLIGKVGSGTKLYGSITAQDIADQIADKTGVKVDKRRVGLADPIKVLGNYQIPVRLHSDVSVPIAVEVMTQEQIALRKAQQEALAAAEAAKAAEEAATAVAKPETPAEADTNIAADQAAEESAGE